MTHLSLTTEQAQWMIIGLLLAALVLVFIIYIIVIVCIAKKLAPKVEDKYLTLVSFERERLQLCKNLLEDIINTGNTVNPEFNDLLTKIENVFDNNIVEERSFAKQTIDFILFYAKKYDVEKNLLTVERREELQKALDKSETAYKDYNKLASRFNSLRSMPLCGLFLRKLDKATLF